MKSKILLLALIVAVLSSCTTAYKTGQTPDDVYYSPTRPQDEYVRTQKEDDRQYRNNEDVYTDDSYLRMKVRNRYRWSDFDDPYYNSNRYNSLSYNCSCFGNPWTPSSYWNNYYNPYSHSYIIVNPKTTVAFSGPRTFNLASYNNNAITNGKYSNSKINSSGNNNNNNTYTAPRNSNSNKNNNSGNILREIFGGNSNNNSSGSNTNTKSSSSGSSSNNSSGSSSSGSGSSPAPVRKF